MWVSTERDVIAHTHRERRLLALRYDCHLERECIWRQRSRIIAVDLCGSACDVDTTEQGADDRALARPVGTSESSYLPEWTCEADAVNCICARGWVKHHQIFHRDHDALRSCTRKNGTPRRAVIAPSGNSIGDASVRAARSAATTSVPPINPAARISGRCALKPIARAMCGTTSPTNPTR